VRIVIVGEFRIDVIFQIFCLGTRQWSKEHLPFPRGKPLSVLTNKEDEVLSQQVFAFDLHACLTIRRKAKPVPHVQLLETL